MEKTDKRCAIVRATLDLVAEQGFHGAPMALVAERAGVAAGTIYRYFESKDVLINEVYHYLEERFFEAVMEGYPEDDPVRGPLPPHRERAGPLLHRSAAGVQVPGTVPQLPLRGGTPSGETLRQRQQGCHHRAFR